MEERQVRKAWGLGTLWERREASGGVKGGRNFRNLDLT